jgi:hypothetical protein
MFSVAQLGVERRFDLSQDQRQMGMGVRPGEPLHFNH